MKATRVHQTKFINIPKCSPGNSYQRVIGIMSVNILVDTLLVDQRTDYVYSDHEYRATVSTPFGSNV